MITDKRCITALSNNSHHAALATKSKYIDPTFSTTSHIHHYDILSGTLDTIPAQQKFNALLYVDSRILCACENGIASIYDNKLNSLMSDKVMEEANCVDYNSSKKVMAIGGTELMFHSLEKNSCYKSLPEFECIKSLSFNRISHILCLVNNNSIHIVDLRTKQQVLSKTIGAKSYNGEIVAKFDGTTNIIYSTDRVYRLDLLNNKTETVSELSNFSLLSDSIICYGDGVAEYYGGGLLDRIELEIDELNVSSYNEDVVVVGSSRGVDLLSKCSLFINNSSYCPKTRGVILNIKKYKVVVNLKIVGFKLVSQLDESSSVFKRLVDSREDVKLIKEVLVDVYNNYESKNSATDPRITLNHNDTLIKSLVDGDVELNNYKRSTTDPKITLNHNDPLIKSLVDGDLVLAYSLCKEQKKHTLLQVFIGYKLGIPQEVIDPATFLFYSLLTGDTDVLRVSAQSWLILVIFLCNFDLNTFRNKVCLLNKQNDKNGIENKHKMILSLLCKDTEAYFSMRSTNGPISVFDYYRFINEFRLVYEESVALEYKLDSKQCVEYERFLGKNDKQIKIDNCNVKDIDSGSIKDINSDKDNKDNNNGNSNKDNNINDSVITTKLSTININTPLASCVSGAYSPLTTTKYSSTINETIPFKPNSSSVVSPLNKTPTTYGERSRMSSNRIPVQGTTNKIQPPINTQPVVTHNTSSTFSTPPPLVSKMPINSPLPILNMPGLINTNYQEQSTSSLINNQQVYSGLNSQTSSYTPVDQQVYSSKGSSQPVINENQQKYSSPASNYPPVNQQHSNLNSRVSNYPPIINESQQKYSSPASNYPPINQQHSNLNSRVSNYPPIINESQQKYSSPASNYPPVNQQHSNLNSRVSNYPSINQQVNNQPIGYPNISTNTTINNQPVPVDESLLNPIVAKIEFLKTEAMKKKSLILRAKTRAGILNLEKFNPSTVTNDLLTALQPFFNLVGCDGGKEKIIANASIECDRVVRVFNGVGDVELWLPSAFTLLQVVLSD